MAHSLSNIDYIHNKVVFVMDICLLQIKVVCREKEYSGNMIEKILIYFKKECDEKTTLDVYYYYKYCNLNACKMWCQSLHIIECGISHPKLVCVISTIWCVDRTNMYLCQQETHA